MDVEKYVFLSWKKWVQVENGVHGLMKNTIYPHAFSKILGKINLYSKILPLELHAPTNSFALSFDFDAV